MSQLQIVHTNMHQIANEPIHMLHQAADQQNTVQNNNAIGGGGGGRGGRGGGGGGGGGGNAGTVGPPPPGNAMLSGTPRTLNQLWDEYMVEIGGQKPAHLFTRDERGACKQVQGGMG